MDTFDLLGDALAQPVIVPELRAQTPDADLLRRCFDYTELLLTSPSLLLREAAYFQILEALLDESSVREGVPVHAEPHTPACSQDAGRLWRRAANGSGVLRGAGVVILTATTARVHDHGDVGLCSFTWKTETDPAAGPSRPLSGSLVTWPGAGSGLMRSTGRIVSCVS
ncbi:hypothetical protein [Streptomyces albidoflavus]|uniref:hypothetical protein n=1 Tax=Streptomyces albidoflavus TaxID=1886 RepID=UPI0033CBFE0F